MSGIINSFFIEPVVRQARRFSIAPRKDATFAPKVIEDEVAVEDQVHLYCIEVDKGWHKPERRARASSLQEDYTSTTDTIHQSHASHRSGSDRPAALAHPSHQGASHLPLHHTTTQPAQVQPKTTTTQDSSTTDHNVASSISTCSRAQSIAATASRPVLALGLFDRFAPLVTSPFVSRGSNKAGPAPRTTNTSSRNSGMSDHIVNSNASLNAGDHDSDPVASSIASVPIGSESITDDRRSDYGIPIPSTVAPISPFLHDPDAHPSSPNRRTRSTRFDRNRWVGASSAPASTTQLESLVARRKQTQEEVKVAEEALRRRIQALWKLEITSEERARRMHDVMTEKYRSFNPALPQSIHLQRPTSSSSIMTIDSGSSSRTKLDNNNPYNLTEEDLKITLRPKHVDEELEHNDEVYGELGCEHYKRNVKVQCFECRTWWNCRYCHDMANLGHDLPRHMTENMLCMLCQTAGPAGQYCQGCGERASYYYCDVCKLWDDDNTRAIYHCSDCGICRLGEGIGKDYDHCKRCNVCIPIQMLPYHRCIERATDCGCPICSEYLFHSPLPIVSMPCGHYLHQNCYTQYMQSAFACPVCKKSAVNMESHWRKLDEEIQRQPMPSVWQNTMVDIQCNDCSKRSRVKYHWLGNRCMVCDSFNTVEEGIIDAPHSTGNNPAHARPRWRTARNVSQPRARGYFEFEEEEVPRPQSSSTLEVPGTEAMLGLSNTAYEMLAAMSRNLSPIRRYLNSEVSTNADTDAASTAPDSNTDAGFNEGDQYSGNGDEALHGGQANDEDEGEDEDSDSESERGFLFDSDSDESDDPLDIQLLGHR